ncbi:MAG: polysaccharide pyruvyl transferase family protein [Gemmatimonadales bacterium]
MIIQTGSNELDNLGDRAMLEVLIDRVRSAHPETIFSVFARDAERVRCLDRAVEQVPVEQKRAWAIFRSVALALGRALPALDWLVRKQTPWWYASILRFKARSLVNPEVLEKSDILLVSGGGFITDVFIGQAWPVLERLSEAETLHIPFVLLGQGFGPLRDPELVRKARDILPHARLIAIRETRHSLPLLLELGVSPKRIVVTGDDAIEPAYKARRDTTGDLLGVNFRVAEYAGITQSDVDRLRPPMRSLAEKLSTKLVALPVCIVASVEASSDAKVAAQLVNPRVEGTGGTDDEIPQTPVALIERISGCRVVVTGSYHAAVFALAQGIPSVCVYNTEYYGNKFRGLAHEFGDGCDVIDKSRTDFEAALMTAIESAWNRAEDLRGLLQNQAARQIVAQHHAYERLSGIIDSLTVSDGESQGCVA